MPVGHTVPDRANNVMPVGQYSEWPAKAAYNLKNKQIRNDLLYALVLFRITITLLGVETVQWARGGRVKFSPFFHGIAPGCPHQDIIVSVILTNNNKYTAPAWLSLLSAVNKLGWQAGSIPYPYALVPLGDPVEVRNDVLHWNLLEYSLDDFI